MTNVPWISGDSAALYSSTCSPASSRCSSLRTWCRPSVIADSAQRSARNTRPGGGSERSQRPPSSSVTFTYRISRGSEQSKARRMRATRTGDHLLPSDRRGASSSCIAGLRLAEGRSIRITQHDSRELRFVGTAPAARIVRAGSAPGRVGSIEGSPIERAA